MKKLIFLLFFVISSFISHSQSEAIELKTYCFGNSEHNLMNKLSDKSRTILSSFLKKYNIDTFYLYRVRYNEVFTKFTSDEYLRNHKYVYYNWDKYGDIININEYNNFQSSSQQKFNKIIILYSTNDKDIENLSVYVLN